MADGRRGLVRERFVKGQRKGREGGQRKRWRTDKSTPSHPLLVIYRCFVTAPHISFRRTRYHLSSGRFNVHAM